MNLKRFLSLTKHALLATAVFVTLGISSCDNDDDGPTTFNGTVLELMADVQFKQSATVSADVALDSALKYFNLYPDLVTLLTATPNVTVFAPSNTAFVNLLATPGFPTKISLINPDIIKGVLAYHIVSEKKIKADLTSGATLTSNYTDPTAGVQTITVNANGTLKTGSTNQDIDIVDADNLATNGAVHVVESVMIPPSVGATLTPILGTTAGTILLGKDFSYLAYMIGYADAGVATASKVSSILANPINPNTNPNGFTVFAPLNAVFIAAYNAANSQPANNVPTKEQVQGFITTAWTGGGAGTAAVTLKNHIVMGKYVVTAAAGSTTLTNGLTMSSLASVTLTTVVGTPSAPSNPYGVVMTSPSTPTSQAPIVSKDLAHSNGIVQVIAGILKPQ
ncbi:MAG: fasciclin domain-containing protein [Bacteroidota bacterium]